MYIRVSEILARLQSFDHIDPAILDTKAKIGTQVHNAIIQDAQGLFPLLETQRAAAYFQSYLYFKQDAKPIYRMQVPRLYCDDLMITGEIDAIADLGMQYPTLLDWKCSAQINEEIWEMQAHFYWYLLEMNDIRVSDMRWVNLRHRKELIPDDCGDVFMTDYDEGGEEIERRFRYHYYALKPKVVPFIFREEVLSRCIDEAKRAWEEKKDSLVLD